VVSRLLERLLADERELNDLRAVRDALTPPELAAGPASSSPRRSLKPRRCSSATWSARVWARHAGAAFIRTVFATTAPFSDDPARLLSWANTSPSARRDLTVNCRSNSANDHA
jgi:hypothetical protein